MFCPLKLILMPVLLDYSLGLNDLIVSSLELTVHVGDSALLGCVFQSTEEKHVTKVDWMFSSGEHAKEEVVLRYYPKLSVPVGYSENWGRFQNRVTLVGDTSHNDASILLQGVKESDRGSYTCSIHLGNLTFRKTTTLHVIVKEPRTLVTPVALRPEILGGNQVVIIVGIVCGTVLLLPVLILTMKRTHRNESSVTSTMLVKSLENVKKPDPEKHVYSSIATREQIEVEEESSGKAEATYMTMHPVWPSLRSAPSNPADKRQLGEF